MMVPGKGGEMHFGHVEFEVYVKHLSEVAKDEVK